MGLYEQLQSNMNKTSTWYHHTYQELPENIVVEVSGYTGDYNPSGFYVEDHIDNISVYGDNIYEVVSDIEPYLPTKEEQAYPAYYYPVGTKLKLKKVSKTADMYDRLGRCYELAYTYLMNECSDIDFLVHGSIEAYGNPRIKHAVVRLTNGDICDAVLDQQWSNSDYKQVYDLQEDNIYTRQQAKENALFVYRNYGPWE